MFKFHSLQNFAKLILDKRMNLLTHMLRTISALFIAAAFLSRPAFCLDTKSPPRAVSLSVIFVIDGLPYYQLVQNEKLLGENGLRRLTREGASFSDAQYSYVCTYTAPGHATLMTGANPNRHGLIGNYWSERKTGARIYALEDPAHHYLEETNKAEDGTSPTLLKLPTVGDTLREATGSKARVFGISGKDRGAILGAGKSGTAFFFGEQTGRFITTDYYMTSYPAWWKTYYEARPQNSWFGTAWDLLREESAYSSASGDNRAMHIDFMHLGRAFPLKIDGGAASPSLPYYKALSRTPFATDYLVDFAQHVIRSENLGRNPEGVPDLLVLSLSTHDYANHLFGPESRQSLDSLLRIDAAIARFLSFLDGWTGMDKTLIVLTSDHGFPPTAEHCSQTGQPAGRIDAKKMKDELNASLAAQFGEAKFIQSWRLPTFYLDYVLIEELGLKAEIIENAAADFLRVYPGIAEVYTRTQLQSGASAGEPGLFKKVINSWNPFFSGDLFLIQKPCWYLLDDPHHFAANHGSPYAYDTQVPVIFSGPGVKAGSYTDSMDVKDIAPTVSFLLGVPSPGGSEGRVLTEIIQTE